MINNQLNKLISKSTAPAFNLKEQNKTNVSKWERTGLLEGLRNDFEKAGIAMLLENQARQLVKEASQTGMGGNAEEWNGVALPLVRRIFSEITAKEFVSVQPMSMPSGLVFYLDFKYGTAQPGFTTGAGRTSQADSVYGTTNTANDAFGGLYGPGRFGYSINDQITGTLTVGASPGSTNYASSSVLQADYDWDEAFFNTYSASIANGSVFKITVSTDSFTRPDTKGVRAFVPTGSAIKGYFPQFTKTNQAETQITFVVSASSAAGTSVRYQAQPTSTQRGDFEDPVNGTDIGIPEINLELRSEEIVAKMRKLKTIWTPEFAQDLNAYHAIDAEAELTSMLSEYISQEVDLEILDMLLSKAVNTQYWSATTGEEFDPLTNSFSPYGTSQAASSAYTQQTWFQTLGTKIRSVSNSIHQKTMRGGANFLACSPKISTILESISGYAADTDGNAANYAFGSQKVGTINGKIQVYKIPYMQENQILIGYRGSQFLETGAVYAPYIPLIMTPLVFDPNNFTPRKGVMTRYAKKMIRPEFYGRIYVHGLDKI
jgi:hypothetical protein